MEPNEHYVIQIEDLEVRIPFRRIDAYTLNISVPKAIPATSFLAGSEYTVNIPQEQFFNDILQQIPPSLNGKFIEVAFESLFTVIFNHLQKFGNLQPRDLDIYIAENLMLYNGIREASNNGSFGQEQKEALFATFYSKILDLLPPAVQDEFYN